VAQGVASQEMLITKCGEVGACYEQRVAQSTKKPDLRHDFAPKLPAGCAICVKVQISEQLGGARCGRGLRSRIFPISVE
jgi:hypothetical protein